MALYRNLTTGEIRDISDALMAAWEANGNPKAQQWESYTPPPPEPPTPPEPPEPDWARFRDQMLPLFDVIIKQEMAKGNPAERAASIQLLPTYFLAERNGADEFGRVWRDLTPDAKTVQFAIALATDCHLPPEFIAALTPTTP